VIIGTQIASRGHIWNVHHVAKWLSVEVDMPCLPLITTPVEKYCECENNHLYSLPCFYTYIHPHVVFTAWARRTCPAPSQWQIASTDESRGLSDM
jgi:hypothetical protein